MIANKRGLTGWFLFAWITSWSGAAFAQDDPFAGELGSEPATDAPEAPEPPSDEQAPVEDVPSEQAPPADQTPPAEPAPDPAITAELGAPIDAASRTAPAAERDPQYTGSHIRRPRLVVDGALIIDSPLRTETQGREFLQIRQQLSGAAVPDVAAALGIGGAGTTRTELRLQPTLILLNGRRLVSAPFFGPSGTDFVDLNQIPIQLVERTEITSGLAAGLYGEGAMGGVVNFTTRRDIEGIDIELGGQATDRFDQGEADVTVLLGTGKGKSGANLMLGYFNRQPLAARDRAWIGERTDRVESFFGSPATYQQLSNFDYPIADPLCPVAARVGHSTGYAVRLRGYGPPGTLDQLTPDQRMLFLTGYDQVRGLMADRNDGDIDALQSPTYCAADYTGSNDLVLKDERIQAYSTLWHALSDHTELYGEAGYYRSENENRTAAAFPLTRLASNVAMDSRVLVPRHHPDQPVDSYGFAAVEVSQGRVPNELFFVGRTQGNFNGDGVHDRRIDVFRGVLGIKGDLAGVAPNSILSTWDWDLSGTYTTSELLSRVNDTLLDKLQIALNSCPTEKLDPDSLMMVPTSISDRQNAGCFNPFYSGVLNNAAIDPLNVSSQSAQASRAGFITGDTDVRGRFGYGTQDGGYICDPNDPNSPPCPEVDLDGDGIVDPWPAGQPNTQEVIDRITGQHFQYQQRTLAVVGLGAQGKLADFGDGELALALGSQYRRESLLIDYDAAYNQRLFGFLYGADDLDPVTRDVIAGYVEARLRLADGLIEVQPAARVEAYDTVGVGINGLLGVSVRPFAKSGSAPLEYLGLRGHIGHGQQAPTLTQLYGQMNEFALVEYRGSTLFIPHQVSGNTNLEFEKYTTISGGPRWDWAGIHVGTDFWMTFISDVITFDNSRTLVNDCRGLFARRSQHCTEMAFLPQSDSLDHIESRFDNMASVDSNGVDGTISYTLDTKRRGLGDFGTFLLAVQGTYINSYLIKGPRVLTPYYRDGAPAVNVPDVYTDGAYVLPSFNADGSRNYDGITAEYEAAGFRNFENFAPPIPKLRFSVPVRWMYSGHTVGATMRFIDGYYDDSEFTIEERNLPGINSLQFANGEKIASMTMFDALYSLEFGSDAWKGMVTVGVLNIGDAAPPAVESPLGYEVGLHDPRGRTIYARVSGDF